MDSAETVSAVNTALEVGYRHIDTAYAYRNEADIGKVLQQWFSSGKLKREDIFITTKVPPTCPDADSIEGFMKKSLEALQLDYVDLYLIHTPVGLDWGEKTGEFSRFEIDRIAFWKVSSHLDSTIFY